jgi:hypothetical protein
MDNGVLECRYHGWQFSSEGSCIANPQSGRPAKACLDMYPTQVGPISTPVLLIQLTVLKAGHPRIGEFLKVTGFCGRAATPIACGPNIGQVLEARACLDPEDVRCEDCQLYCASNSIGAGCGTALNTVRMS